MSTVHYTLVAFHVDLYHSWLEAFRDVPEVRVEEGDILERSADAIVSPANSFGYMDGGLDLKYSQTFGWELEKRVRAVLEEQHFGELPVGNAIIVPTGLAAPRFLISAPTMRVPSDVSNTANAYLAFRAILAAVTEHNRRATAPIRSVLCPGLGTGEGRLAPELCARQMRAAYEVCLRGGMLMDGGLAGAVRHHMYLLGED